MLEIDDIQGAIFDLDGTLIDSMEIWREIDEEFFAARGMSVPDDYQEKIAHLGFREVAAYTVREYLPSERAEDLISEWNEMCRAKYGARHSAKYFKEGAAELVVRLKNAGLRLCVATASSPDFFLPVLRAGGVDRAFECVVTVDDVKKDKSYPDIFLRCAQKLGLPPGKIAVFEDNLTAIRSAKRAGMKTVAVYDKISEAQVPALKREADRFIYRFAELKI